ncbi:MAG TPA: hypothetical protein PKJ10_07555, partial [Smithella sp.]|nr:hypothetical protein [Smithella sp.]
MERHRDQKTPKRRMSFPVQKTAIVLAVISVILLIAFLLSRNVFSSFALQASRIKNTFAHYALKEKPQFYYLELEKNGKDIRVGRNNGLEITYRDEFVVKSVVSDDLSGRYTYVKFDGFSDRDNDLGVFLKG